MITFRRNRNPAVVSLMATAAESVGAETVNIVQGFDRFWYVFLAVDDDKHLHDVDQAIAIAISKAKPRATSESQANNGR